MRGFLRSSSALYFQYSGARIMNDVLKALICRRQVGVNRCRVNIIGGGKNNLVIAERATFKQRHLAGMKKKKRNCSSREEERRSAKSREETRVSIWRAKNFACMSIWQQQKQGNTRRASKALRYRTAPARAYE